MQDKVTGLGSNVATCSSTALPMFFGDVHIMAINFTYCDFWHCFNYAPIMSKIMLHAQIVLYHSNSTNLENKFINTVNTIILRLLFAAST